MEPTNDMIERCMKGKEKNLKQLTTTYINLGNW